MNNEPVAYACKIIEAEFETNILKIEMLDKDYKVSAGIKYLSNTHPVKELTDEEIHNLMDEIEVLVHGDIKRAMYRMARKVESILNE